MGFNFLSLIAALPKKRLSFLELGEENKLRLESCGIMQSKLSRDKDKIALTMGGRKKGVYLRKSQWNGV